MSTQTVLIFCLILAFECINASCPDGWTRFGGSCYYFGHNDVSFLDAQKYCEGFHGYLVNINDEDENKFVTSYLEDLKDDRHWIGLTDELIEDVWKHYPSETTATFFNWAPGDPNQLKGANCVAIFRTSGYRWIDEPCTNRFRPLCELSIEAQLG
ncbi:hypothetical protein ACF0H5_022524 [Mactra antiquata]